MVTCPICNRAVKSSEINSHIDSQCKTFILEDDASAGAANTQRSSPIQSQNVPSSSATKRSAADFFSTPASKRQATASKVLTPFVNGSTTAASSSTFTTNPVSKMTGAKRSFDEGPGEESPADTPMTEALPLPAPPIKKHKANRAAPLAERMRPVTLDDVTGQDLVGPNGVLRALIESDSMPSIILWGGSGTGKTTIARCIAKMVGSRFVEINATSCGTAECKKLFQDASNELSLTGRRTIIFCDEIHRFSKAQQDVFLKPVEAGTITLVGATTENPSFKVQAALLSRCRTFTLQKLSAASITDILVRALKEEYDSNPSKLSPLIDEEFLRYLSAFADGDARTALNLLELALSLTSKPDISAALTKKDIKTALTKTLVYDRAGDQHYGEWSSILIPLDLVATTH